MSTTFETKHPLADDPSIEIKPSVLYVGTPVLLVTTLNPDGSANISPMSSAWALFDRVVLGMTATSQGRANALRTRHMVLNFPAPDQWQQVEALARATGRDPVPAHKQAIGYHHAPDKFALSGFTPAASAMVQPPRIAECPIQFEAELTAAHDPAGDWPEDRPEAYQILETRVLRVHAHRDIVIPGTNHIDTARWGPLLYVFRHYLSTGRDLGRTFKAEV